MEKCKECDSTNIEWVEIKGFDHQTNKEFFNDTPYCSDCFEQEAEVEDVIENQIKDWKYGRAREC